jgi:hypothetical protein
MTSSEDSPPGFAGWLRSVTYNDDLPEKDQGEISPSNLRWLRRFFDVEGAVDRDVVSRAFLNHQVMLANEAVAAVLGDLHRTSAMLPTVVVDDYEGNGVRIRINDGYTAPSMWESERPEAFVEIAQYFQDQLDLADYLQEFADVQGCWPLCGEHGTGLRAEVHDGTAVWRCYSGAHTVAPVGELGS